MYIVKKNQKFKNVNGVTLDLKKGQAIDLGIHGNKKLVNDGLVDLVNPPRKHKIKRHKEKKGFLKK